MAKSFVKIPLATKCRLLFGMAVILIIGAALIVPWLYLSAMVDEEALRTGGELTRLYGSEWEEKHVTLGTKGADRVGHWFTLNDATGVRKGPLLIARKKNEPAPQPPDRAGKRAVEVLQRELAQEVLQVVETDDLGRRIYRTYRAVRATDNCVGCHSTADASKPDRPVLRDNELAAIISVDMPAGQSASSLAVGRLVIIGAGLLAFLLAVLTFYFITQKLILSPVRKLKVVADKVSEGDLTVRSGITTGDEFEQLGRSFDEMLAGLTESQTQLRAANRALDLKLNELAESNVALFETNRVKTEFLANVSHELRTPLNSIIGFAELLAETEDARMHRYAQNILTSARMLLQIINDLLDLAKIEAGKGSLTVTKVSISDICETLISLVTPQAGKKNLALSLQLDGDVPTIETDAGKVQQILYNLLSNAIKFTPAGGSVTISAGTVGDKGVFIRVADTGPGISEAEQSRIFDKFYQVGRTVTREHGGAGLGLAIAKELASLLGGKLRLQSEPGKGATFELVLPPAVPQQA